MLLKYGEDGAGRLASLELSCEWMGKNIVLCVLFVGSQGIIENKLEIGGGGARRVSMRHEGGDSEVFVREKRKMAESQIGKKGIDHWALDHRLRVESRYG